MKALVPLVALAALASCDRREPARALPTTDTPAADPAIEHVLGWLSSMWDEAPAPDLGLGDGRPHAEPACNDKGPNIGTRLHAIMAAHPDLDAKVVTKRELHGPLDVSGIVAARANATYVVVEASGSNLRKAGLRQATITAAVVSGADGTLHVEAVSLDNYCVPEAEL
jgi:hypothetical protein